MEIKHCKTNKDGDVTLFDKIIPLNENQKTLLKNRGLIEKDVILGVRPEHFSLDKKKAILSCKVELSEMMGSEYYIHAFINDQKLIIRTPIIGLEKDVIDVIENRGQLDFSFSFDNIHIFDKESEEAIF